MWIDGTLVSPGRKSLFGERLVGGCRVWDPRRSKCAALFTKDTTLNLTPEMRVLYLGAGHGATASHIAEYVEMLYAVEIAPRPFRDLLRICRDVQNIIPLMADATKPGTYAPFVEMVDFLYQDVAHPEQAEIALRNRIFLRPGGLLVLMLKTACVDSTRPPEDVFQETVDIIRRGYGIRQLHWLSPYFPDHATIIAEVIK